MTARSSRSVRNQQQTVCAQVLRNQNMNWRNPPQFTSGCCEGWANGTGGAQKGLGSAPLAFSITSEEWDFRSHPPFVTPSQVSRVFMMGTTRFWNSSKVR